MENKGKNTFASFSLSAAPAGGPVWPSCLMDSKKSEKKYKIDIRSGYSCQDAKFRSTPRYNRNTEIQIRKEAVFGLVHGLSKVHLKIKETFNDKIFTLFYYGTIDTG